MEDCNATFSAAVIAKIARQQPHCSGWRNAAWSEGKGAVSGIILETALHSGSAPTSSRP